MIQSLPEPKMDVRVSPFPSQQLSLWPSRPRPEADELLSSWMIRLAHANGHKVQPFYRFWLGSIAQPLWARDVDRSIDGSVVVELAERTGIPAATLEQATLRSFESTVFNSFTERGHLSWLMPLGIFHRDRRRAGLMCCPACLKGDREPYFRKTWRLSLSVACVRHGVLLVEQCAHCKATIQPHRADHRNRSWLPAGITLAHCWNCHSDLRDQSCEDAPDAVLDMQRQLLQVFDKGHVDAAGCAGLHSYLFLQGVRVLIAALLRIPEFRQEGISERQQFELFNVRQRARILGEIRLHLTSWPDRFQQVFSTLPRAYSQLTRCSLERPYWIDKEISLLNKTRLRLTQDEIEAIERLMEARNAPLRAKHVSEEFGRDLSRHIARTRKTVSDDYVDSLLCDLDHAISVAHGIDRLDLIRDRGLLLSARILRLSQRALGELQVEDSDATDEDDLPLEDVPRDKAALQAYLRRFARLDRRHYAVADKCQWLFPCRSPTGKMSESLVNARYINALRISRCKPSSLPYSSWLARPSE
jgi:hypothetical protein